MTLTKQDRNTIVSKFQAHPLDTGSTAVQVALLTERIKYISSHLKTNPTDHSGERGLLKLVGQRKRLLRYLSHTNFDEYQSIIKQLKMRK